MLLKVNFLLSYFSYSRQVARAYLLELMAVSTFSEAKEVELEVALEKKSPWTRPPS